MADRIFAGITLAIIVAYGVIAFTVIKAPFQYDPLGPESWPRILSVAAGLCCVVLIVRPVTFSFDTEGGTMIRIVMVVAMLGAYAAMFEPLGFMLSTALFCAAMTRLLGGDLIRAAAFGVAAGVLGYLIGTGLLELNLPAGLGPDVV